MAVELPTSPVCDLCPAKRFYDGRFWCDKSRLDGISKKQPLLCPLPGSSNNTNANVYEILRNQLRNK